MRDFLAAVGAIWLVSIAFLAALFAPHVRRARRRVPPSLEPQQPPYDWARELAPCDDPECVVCKVAGVKP